MDRIDKIFRILRAVNQRFSPIPVHPENRIKAENNAVQVLKIIEPFN